MLFKFHAHEKQASKKIMNKVLKKKKTFDLRLRDVVKNMDTKGGGIPGQVTPIRS